MASDGTRVRSLPPKQRSSVLRAGIRLVSPDRLSPYDLTPDEPTIEDFVAAYGSAFKHIGRAFAPSFEAVSRQMVIVGRQFGKALEASRGTHDFSGAIDFYLPDKPSQSPILPEKGTPKDHRPKKIRQIEPGYVSLTRIKRR